MKVSSISVNLTQRNLFPQQNQTPSNKVTCLFDETNLSKINLPQIYYTPNLNFGIANSAKLKTLFTYGVPCIYSGVEMVDPKRVQKLMKSGILKKPIPDVMKALKPFEGKLIDIEKRVYNLLKRHEEEYPNETLQDVFKKVAPKHNKRLRKKQNIIFNELREITKDLPEDYQYQFKLFMDTANDKLDNKPVIVPFSASEFKYKLNKIENDIAKQNNIKGTKAVRKMIKECDRFAPDTNPATINTQLNVVKFLGIILKTSSVSKYKPLQELIDTSIDRLKGRKVYMPFKRKAFIYDLNKLVEKLPNKDLKEKLANIAEKLPTSEESISAYFLKFATEPSEKIAYRILWPNMASVEHLYPQSCGGEDAMYNFAGAGARENAKRGNIEFEEQLKRKPKTPIYCQKYIDRMIELANSGVFRDNYIDTNYIEQFKKTIQKLSKNSIVLDTSKLSPEASLPKENPWTIYQNTKS